METYAWLHNQPHLQGQQEKELRLGVFGRWSQGGSGMGYRSSWWLRCFCYLRVVI